MQWPRWGVIERRGEERGRERGGLDGEPRSTMQFLRRCESTDENLDLHDSSKMMLGLSAWNCLTAQTH